MERIHGGIPSGGPFVLRLAPLPRAVLLRFRDCCGDFQCWPSFLTFRYGKSCLSILESQEELDVVVLSAGKDVLRTVKLLGEDEPDQLMREDQLGERPGEIRSGMNAGIYAVGAADDDYDIA